MGDFLSAASCHLTLVALLARGRFIQAVLLKLLSCCAPYKTYVHVADQPIIQFCNVNTNLSNLPVKLFF